MAILLEASKNDIYSMIPVCATTAAEAKESVEAWATVNAGRAERSGRRSL